jgi:hypothetical protein
MEEVLATPTVPQMTDVAPNRWGTNDPPERNDDQDDDLKAGEEVRDYKIPFNNRPSSSRRNSHRSPWISSSISPYKGYNDNNNHSNNSRSYRHAGTITQVQTLTQAIPTQNDKI